MCSTPVSECESLMESLLLDIRNGLGRRSLRKPHDASPSPGKILLLLKIKFMAIKEIHDIQKQ